MLHCSLISTITYTYFVRSNTNLKIYNGLKKKFWNENPTEEIFSKLNRLIPLVSDSCLVW